MIASPVHNAKHAHLQLVDGDQAGDEAQAHALRLGHRLRRQQRRVDLLARHCTEMRTTFCSRALNVVTWASALLVARARRGGQAACGHPLDPVLPHGHPPKEIAR